MWKYEKKLQYPVNIKKKNLKMFMKPLEIIAKKEMLQEKSLLSNNNINF